MRLQLGAEVSLLTTGDSSRLRLPAFAHLDLGYAFSEALGVLARVSTWLSYDPFALSFLGVGVMHGFEPDGMFITGLIGLSFRDPDFGLQGDEEREGLAFHFDLGQRFVLADQLYFGVGAHFDLGTPLGASALKFTSIGFGPVLSLRWGG